MQQIEKEHNPLTPPQQAKIKPNTTRTGRAMRNNAPGQFLNLQLEILREALGSDEESSDENDGDDTDPFSQVLPVPPTAEPGEATLKRLLSKSPVPWDEIIVRLRSNPQEAAMYGFHNQSPLQRAIMEEDPVAPLAAISALLKAHPQAAFHVDDEGRSALYYASYYKRGEDIVRTILEAAPNMVKRASAVGTLPLHVAYTEATARLLTEQYADVIKMRDGDGEIPLHGAASWGDSGAVDVLLEAGRSLFVGGVSGASGSLVTDSRDKTPLDRACELIVATCSERIGQGTRYGVGRRSGLRQSFVFRRVPMDGSTALRELEGADAKDNWRKLELLAEEAALFTVFERGEKAIARDSKRRENYPILHSVVALALPPEVVWHAANLYRNQIELADLSGRLPIHHAAQSIGKRRRDEGIMASLEVINILLYSTMFGSTRAAGIVDKDGRYALHTAAALGLDSDNGIDALVSACPLSLEKRDQITGLFPFALAAATDGSVNNAEDISLRCSNPNSGNNIETTNNLCDDAYDDEEQMQSSDVDTIYRLLREAPSVLQLQCSSVLQS